MRKFFFYILPLVLIFLLYQVGQESQFQGQSLVRYESYLKQKSSLVALTQNYLMLRIETLQMISSASSPVIKKTSEKFKQTLNYDLDQILNFMSSNIQDNEERLIFKKMTDKLDEIKESIAQSGLQSASNSIENMFDKRMPFREANEAYGNFLNMKISKALEEYKNHKTQMDRLVKILAAFQAISIAFGIYYVRSVRS